MIFIAALISVSAFAQEDLQRQLGTIAAEARGKVSIACSLPGSKLNCDLNPHGHPPMQSVFKAPLGLTVLHLVEQGKFTLDQLVRFLASDRILPHAFSPLQDKYPNGEVDVPLRELIRLAVSESDNVAADILLRIIGGPPAVEAYVKSLGVQGFHIRDGEGAMHRNTALQYRNWFEPAGAAGFLRLLADRPPCNEEHMSLFLGWMKTSARPARIGGMLPTGTIVMHKAGTSDTDHGLTHAWNDIGLIVLPDGRRLAIAVFITDSTAGEAALDPLIARIARTVYDAAIGK